MILWNLSPSLNITGRLRWIGRQYVDSGNQLMLGAAVMADFGISRKAGENIEYVLNVENLTDVRIETGRTFDGVVRVGAPRLATIGVRGAW